MPIGKPTTLIVAALVLAASLDLAPVRVGSASAPGPASAFTVGLAVPSGGDVTYGIARVRIASPAHSQAVQGRLVFAGRIGGLTIVARSRSRVALDRATKLYVIVSKVAGADARVRDVAFFVVRRRASGAVSSGGAHIDVSIPDATPATGSFWVHGVDRRGRAEVFMVHDMLATAVANWTRYIAVLRAARALAAAMHPLEQAHPARGLARQSALRPRARVLWTGGQRPNRRVRAIYRLLIDALGSPREYAAAKANPLIADFIAHDLNNPRLARRWRAVTAKLPLRVPDRYAAAAQEEARFGAARSPKISHARVAIADGTNSADASNADLVYGAFKLNVAPDGPGRILGRTFVYGQNLDCPGTCSASFLTGEIEETLTGVAQPGYVLTGWHGCDEVVGGRCNVRVGRRDIVVSARFERANGTLLIRMDTRTSGTGTVAISRAGDACEHDCLLTYAPGRQLTLTAKPHAGSTFTGWENNGSYGQGCDDIHGNVCHVTIPAQGLAEVTALFDRPEVVVSKLGGGSGTVTSSPPAIDCGSKCLVQAGDFQVPGERVTLTATPDPGSTFAGWGSTTVGGPGCDSTNGATCVATATLDGRYIDAVFETAARVTVDLAGPGRGRVTSGPAGIDCGLVCSAEFLTDDTVTLTAIPDPGSKFVAWSSQSFDVGCGVHNPTATVCAFQILSQSDDVTASFAPAGDSPPSAAFTASPNPTDPEVPVSFDGSGSSDPGGQITNYQWAFGDSVSETTGTNPRVVHSYLCTGTVTATLTVTDQSGQTGQVSHTVTVAPQAGFQPCR